MVSRMSAMVLGILAEGERHGYELVREMDLRGMLRWTGASKVGVYKALSRLEEEGYLTSWTEKEGRLTERRVYALSAAGEERLDEMVYDLCASEEPVRLHAPVGLALLPRLDRGEAVQALEARMDFLRRQEKRLGGESEMTAGICGEVDGLIRRYELAVYREERRLLNGVMKTLSQGE